MDNTLQDTFHLWAKYLLNHPFIDEDGPCCRRCSIRQRLANCWEGCEMCLDGWMLTRLNRHHRTLLQEYARRFLGSCSSSCSSCGDDMSSLQWRAYWWRTRWFGDQWLLTRWEASMWDEEACDHYGIAVLVIEVNRLCATLETLGRFTLSLGRPGGRPSDGGTIPDASCCRHY